MKRTTALSTLALASALALTGCGTGADEQDTGTSAETAAPATAAPETPSTTSASEEPIAEEHNDADVMFAQMMVPHHEQAVEMSETLLAKEEVPAEVADFAQQVIDAQGPEIERMNAMLEAWGQEPMMESGGMEGMDHGSGAGMSGMMSEEDMQALEDAQGTEASRLYLEQMTAHHEGAVEMARDQVEQGQNPQAVALAQDVIEAQEAEITEMEGLLQGLPSGS
ncbi:MULTISPECIES: DUF305 domain-containing protein [Kocuria]|uniref:DUF305 domain-containing protein n=1 Tax=Kocuria rosea subsp. polaris TaxID=136273 RepID=A0A0W8IAU8_KOCRO|nr:MULTISPECIES: DUF305 domain-containing protein [Kocuria]MCC5784030.1 DUF305 domain-containing protein [Kocuria sp. CCUG 69068]KLU08990.1 hypothetical protein ABL57_14445 [Kocuria sp. SM24M-10]KUG57086.1 DUF305 domain-containing protein [Kocuria polaris]NVC23134.1 DUF305 domain-containing protein [Kocuria salina]OLT06881.1 DUF305 domain-containing protein [Kocuria sp. CNJ-770]